MKNITFLLLFLSVSHLLQAQWVNSGTGNIYYTNGNVGIGTSSPNNRLVVEGSEGGASSLLIRNKSYNSTDNTGTASLQFAFANHVGPKIEAFKVSTNITGLKLYTEYGYNNPQLAMTFKPSAIGTNVGIGTATPTANLEVYNSSLTRLSITSQNEITRLHFRHAQTAQDAFLSYYPDGRFSINLDVNAGGVASNERFTILQNGNVGIGKSTPTAKLHVDGKIIAEEIKVEVVNPPDFVFDPNYHLMPLTQIEAYIKQNHHLPEVPSAAEMEANGIELGKMNMLLLQKIEELTLYVIELSRKNERLVSEVNNLKQIIESENK